MTDENVHIPDAGTGTPENRWAAFTTPELQHLIDSFQGDIWGTDVTTMNAEIRAELERRKDTP